MEEKMKKFMRIFLVLMFVLMFQVLTAQILNDYRSKQDGNWNATASWERFNGTNWVDATATPVWNTANLITIRSGHTITVTANVTIDQTTVENGAILIVYATLTLRTGSLSLSVEGTIQTNSSGSYNGHNTTTMQITSTGKLIHNRNGGAIPVCTWVSGSTCEIVGYTTEGPSNLNQSFHHFIWDCSGQSNTCNAASSNLNTMNGNFIVKNTGTGMLQYVNTADVTKTYQGNFEIWGGTLNMASGAGANVTIDLSGDFILSGGILQSSGGGPQYINFVKSGTQSFTKTGGTIANRINFSVSSATTLDMGTSVLDGSTGNFTLNSGATLITAHAGGIAASGATGCIRNTGTRNFNIGANYVYNGAVAQVTGNGLPANVNNLTVNNPAGVTLTNPVAVNGELTLTAGSLTGSVAVDGYSSPALNYLAIAESNANITGFGVTMTTPTLMPLYVNRQWTLTGSYSGNKSVTFYWTSADDNNFNWGNKIPAVWMGTTKYSALAHNVTTSPYYVTVSIPSSLKKGIYKIGQEGGDGTLPVEMSSFTAVMTIQNFVRLQWVTQSETNLSGYYIFRGPSNNIAETERLNVFIPATNSSQEQIYSFEDTDVTVNDTYYYWLQAMELNGISAFHGPVCITVTEGGGEIPPPVIPVYTGINKIYPNPFGSSTQIAYHLKSDSPVVITIYNLKGQLVKSLVNASKDAGEHTAFWDGRDSSGNYCSSGIYSVVMKAGRHSSSKNIILLK